MRKITLTSIIIISLIGLLAISADAVKIEDLAPANSLVYVTISNLDEVWDAGAASESWQSAFNWKQSESPLPDMNQAMEAMRFTIGVDLRGIVDIFGHQIALVIMPPKSSHRQPKIGLIMNTGGWRREADDIISKVTAVITMNAQKGRSTSNAGQYRKVPYGMVTLENRTFKYGFIDDLLVVGLNEGSFEIIVDTYRKKASSISRDAKYKSIRRKFENVQIFGYANIDNALPILKSFSIQNLEVIIHNLKSVDSIGFGMDALSTDGLQKLYIQMKKGSRKGLPAATCLRAGTHRQALAAQAGIAYSIFRGAKSLKLLPPLIGSEDAFFAMSFDNLTEIWQSLNDNFDDNDLQKHILKLESESGLDFETEILSSLTGEIVMSANISSNVPQKSVSSIPWNEPLVFMELKERTKWQVAVDAIQRLAKAPTLREYKYKSATVREISPPCLRADTHRQAENELFDTLEYGLTDDMFIAATTTSQIQDVIDKPVAIAKESIAMNNFLKRLPAAPSLLLHLNLDKMMPYILSFGESDTNPSNNKLRRTKQNLGSFEYAMSSTKDGLWICFSAVSGKNLMETLGTIVPNIGIPYVKN